MSEQISNSHGSASLPQAKQTKLGLYVTAGEAYEMWGADPDGVKVLDVRTPEEFMFVGHAEMAVNIPIAFQTYDWNVEKDSLAMRPNPEFVAQVKEWARPGDTILAMCRAGGRSAMAVNTLAGGGFTRVYTITDGMEGDSDSNGERTVNGWKNSAPWTYDLDPAQMRLPDQGTG